MGVAPDEQVNRLFRHVNRLFERFICMGVAPDVQVREMGEDVYTLFIHCILHTLYIDILEYDDWLRMDDNLFT